MKKLLILITLSLLASTLHAAELTVRGLFKNAVLLEIDGQQQLVRAGSSHAKGAKVIAANSRSALVRFQGKMHRLQLNKRIGTHYVESGNMEVVLQRNGNREYRSRVHINGRSAEAVVDTGATTVAMSARQARQLGIRYDGAPVVSIATASGVSRGFSVKLNKLAVGGIERRQVPAVVVDGDHPHVILLGMSFLEHVDIQERGNILTLTSH
ncbi:TIGR02281 family clan AA aspartic protease [Spongiibacter sp.]|uniref:retropepsin-like aspartic protease family protein n=1 Tax=Spongiibacter sp. TaxID=2024860 RepID=UPI0035649BE0